MKSEIFLMHLASPNSGELAAILQTARTVPKNTKLTMRIKSKTTVRDLTISLPHKEKLNWMGHPDALLIKAIIAELRERSALTLLQQWGTQTLLNDQRKGPTDLAITGMNKTTPDKINMHIKRPFDTTGVLLNSGSQCIFYQGIRLTLRHSNVKHRRSTTNNIAQTIHAVQEIRKDAPTPAQIWKSIRDPDIPT